MFKKLFALAVESKNNHEFCEKLFKSGLILNDVFDYLIKEGFNSLEEFYNYATTIAPLEVSS